MILILIASHYTKTDRVRHFAFVYLPYNGKIWRVLYLANETFERNWRILIWGIRRGYYTAMTLPSTGKL